MIRQSRRRDALITRLLCCPSLSSFFVVRRVRFSLSLSLSLSAAAAAAAAAADENDFKVLVGVQKE